MSTVWESLEERERRVRGSRTTSAMARAAEQTPDGKSLAEAFATRPFISRDDLRRIGAQSYERPVITLYLNFTPERLVRADRPVFLSVFSSLRHQALDASKGYLDGLAHAQRVGVPEDLAEVQAFLEAFEPQGARALVILKSGAQLNRVVPLPVRVADHLTIEADPFLEPLEAMIDEQHRVLIVSVARDVTAVSIYELGYEHAVEQTAEDVPRETHEAFREGKTERHRETHVVWHFKASAELAERVCRQYGCDQVILIGEENTVKAFEHYLSKALHQRLIGRLQLAPDADQNQRRAAIEDTLRRQRGIEEEQGVSELGYYRGHERLAIGLQMVINAVNLFLVRQLFVRDDLAASGFMCHAHHFLSQQTGSCPFDNHPLEATDNLLDELIEMARLHGVEVTVVSERKGLLEPYDGLAGVLVAPTSAEQLRAVELTS